MTFYHTYKTRRCSCEFIFYAHSCCFNHSCARACRGDCVELYRRVIGKTSSPKTLFFFLWVPYPDVHVNVYFSASTHIYEVFFFFFYRYVYNVKRYYRHHERVTSTQCHRAHKYTKYRQTCEQGGESRTGPELNRSANLMAGVSLSPEGGLCPGIY